MRVVVTGGAGFIGANLCRALASRPGVTEVLAFDDLSSGSARNLEDQPAVRLVEGSILDLGALGAAFEGADAIVHLAARPSVPLSISDPQRSHEVNATGTVRVLEAARAAGRPHVVVASSSSVYGANPASPKREDAVPMPMSPYAVSKLATESYARAYAECFGLETLAFRFFNVFGPLQAAGHAYAAVVPAFVSAALAGRPLTIFGDGAQTRDFTFVDSVTAVLLTNGATVRELEERVADYLGVPFVVAVSSCTAGLMLVLQALDATGRVVLPSFTFAASAHAVVWAGGTPDFADVDAATLTLDPASAAPKLEGAAAMTATHVYGTPCDVERLQRLADDAGMPLVYDAAHALGSRRAGVPVGNFGAAEVFSLSPTKVTFAAEGGLVATRDAALAHACRIGRDYGNPGTYDCQFPGLNARLSELHAAVALASFEGLDERVAHRGALVAAFWQAVSGIPGLRASLVAPGDVSTFKDLTLIVDPDAFGLDVPQLTAALRAEGVDTRRYYYPPIHRQKAYAGLPPSGPLPVTDDLCERVITLPLWSQAQTAEVVRLGESVAALHAAAREIRGALG